MATLDELQAQLAALTQRVNEITAPPDDYYTHRFSGEEIDNAVGRVADTPGSGAITAGDVGAAPSGFGWGNVLRDITVASREETYEEFCAKVDAVISAMPDKTAALVRAYPPAIYGAAATTSSILYKANSNYCVLFNVGAADSTSSGWRMYKDNGTWYPFEMVNPPMKLGVEYRTTERYNGKPVYAFAMNLGQGPAQGETKTVAHNIENMSHIISFGGDITINGTNPLALPFDFSPVRVSSGTLNADYLNFYLVSINTPLTSYTACYAWVKYTKTTD